MYLHDRMTLIWTEDGRGAEEKNGEEFFSVL